MTRDPDDLLAEVAYLASAFHWPLGTLLDLEHADRRRFVALATGDDGDEATVAQAVAESRAPATVMAGRTTER